MSGSWTGLSWALPGRWWFFCQWVEAPLRVWELGGCERGGTTAWHASAASLLRCPLEVFELKRRSASRNTFRIVWSTWNAESTRPS